jgi:F-type H+-transporting ATPase subunit b
VKRRLFLIGVGLWLVIWLGWPLVSPPTLYVEAPKIGSTAAVFSALTLDLAAARAALAKVKKPWREWWDRIWRVLNFLILVILMVKLLRAPIRKFFADQRQEREAELEELERLKDVAEDEYHRVEDKLNGLSREIEELQAHFRERGERVKDEVLTQARYESELILRKAQAAAEARVRVLRERLREEIIDLAASEAERIVTRAITASDRQRLLNDYLTGLKAGTNL